MNNNKQTVLNSSNTNRLFNTKKVCLKLLSDNANSITNIQNTISGRQRPTNIPSGSSKSADFNQISRTIKALKIDVNILKRKSGSPIGCKCQ